VPRQRRFDAVNLRDIQSQAHNHMRLASESCRGNANPMPRRR
jgi:hypothetical protein